ncbi:MAG: endonuclease/exonuclease/phosphatase family protein, partial [Myxococcales bacterium]|nr:endonuclease/exonuclease/phosphatase family protein [Myxococcales bacterium]
MSRRGKTGDEPLRVTCWNVNGVRSATRKGLVNWLQQDAPDFFALQEVRALPQQIPAELTALGLQAHWEP